QGPDARRRQRRVHARGRTRARRERVRNGQAFAALRDDREGREAGAALRRAGPRAQRVERGLGAREALSGALRLVRALRADEAVLGLGEEHVEAREGAVRLRDVLLELEAVGVVELRVAVDALLEDAQLLAHRDDLAEEDVDRNRLLLRSGLAGLQHELTAAPPLADRTRHRLLGVEDGANGLVDLPQILLVEHHDPRFAAAVSAAGPSTPASVPRRDTPCC